MVISKDAFDATIKDYANRADTSFEIAVFDIFESELGVEVAADHEFTLDQIEDAADFYYWTPQREASERYIDAHEAAIHSRLP